MHICFQYRGSYTSGHFIWNLWNEPLTSFINFKWNDHDCKILFIIWQFRAGFFCLQNENCWPTIDTDLVNDVTSSCQSVITHAVMQFLWHDITHWITATPYDKKKLSIFISGKSSEYYRGQLGSYGVSGELATRPVSSLSGGQKSRVAFAVMSMTKWVVS